jgi:hypothetical protein
MTEWVAIASPAFGFLIANKILQKIELISTPYGRVERPFDAGLNLAL